MKCETPALPSGSSREPAPIQKPSETERTLGTRSVISRSPESSSERTYSCTRRWYPASNASRNSQERHQGRRGLADTWKVQNSTGTTEPASGDPNRVAEAAASVGASDVFVFRRVTADRFVHVGGLGRGEGWAGNVDLILGEDERARQAITSAELIVIDAREPVRVFGPYYQRNAVFVPLSADLLVVFGNFEGSDRDSEALTDAAEAAAAAIAQVSSAKRLADELELLHAVQSLAQTDAVRIHEVMKHVVESAIAALSCDLGVIYVAELDEVEAAEHEPSGLDDSAFVPAMRRLFAEAVNLPACIQDSEADPPPPRSAPTASRRTTCCRSAALRSACSR